MSERFHIPISAKSFGPLTVCFALLLVLIVGSVSYSSSFSFLNNAVADDIPEGGGTGGDGGDGGDGESAETGDGGDGGDGGGTKKDGDNDNKGGGGDGKKDGGDGEKKQDSNPKAITLGSCDPGEEPDIFTDKCVVVAENPANTGPANPTPTTCLVSYNPEESDQSSAWGLKIHSGVFYYTIDDKGIQQQKQLSLFHQVQGMQLGKTYDLSAYAGTECNINQVRNNDGSITATITYPNSPGKQVIRTDTTGKVPVQINYLGDSDNIYSSEAIDDNGIATKFNQDVGGLAARGLNSIETTEPGGTRPIVSVVLDSKDGSVKILGRGALGYSSVSPDELQDDNDGDPTVATTKSGMKVTVTPFNVAYPNPGASKDDPLATMSSDHSVVRVTNPDSSVKTHMIINPDGSVQPGYKWTTENPVEPELPIGDRGDGGDGGEE